MEPKSRKTLPPVHFLSAWEPSDEIPGEKWYPLKLSDLDLSEEYAVSNKSRLYSFKVEKVLKPSSGYKGQAVYQLKAKDKEGNPVFPRFYLSELEAKTANAKDGEAIIVSYKQTAKKEDAEVPEVKVKVKPEAIARRKAEIKAAKEGQAKSVPVSAPLPAPYSAELPWMKITPEELTIVKMLLAILEDGKSKHVVATARKGLKRLLDEEERRT